MMTSAEGEQEDVAMLNSCIHTPLLHSEAEIVCEPQMTPFVEAEYVIAYVVVKPLMVPGIDALILLEV